MTEANKYNEPLIPPFRFAVVEEGVFRGGYPMPKNFRFLRKLKLQSILSLTPKKPTSEIQAFCTREGIQSYHVAVPKFKDSVTITHTQVAELLSLLLRSSNHPIFVHCLDGSNVTGVLVMCFRKLQLWGLPAITGEFTRFTRDFSIDTAESEFVEGFRAEIEIPSDQPKWLWRGQRLRRHPTLKVRYQVVEGEEAKNSLPSNVPSTLEQREKKDKEKDKPKMSRNPVRISRSLDALALEGFGERPSNANRRR
eukprot:comp7528_c0_seq1/m.3190 comp7528_c0_seq1/g.3190  ORF comp7528_c0_seq1/g.3190 comp7528_c0_seq1/m.3190 type:complete len:252 (-) comp7528_c0_seq1:252-1007(-)